MLLEVFLNFIFYSFDMFHVEHITQYIIHCSTWNNLIRTNHFYLFVPRGTI